MTHLSQLINQSKISSEKKDFWFNSILPNMKGRDSIFSDYLKDDPFRLEALTDKLLAYQQQLSSTDPSAILAIIDQLIAEGEKEDRIRKTQKDLRKLLLKYRTK